MGKTLSPEQKKRESELARAKRMLTKVSKKVISDPERSNDTRVTPKEPAAKDTINEGGVGDDPQPKKPQRPQQTKEERLIAAHIIDDKLSVPPKVGYYSRDSVCVRI